jgi:hypothetical protein
MVMLGYPPERPWVTSYPQERPSHLFKVARYPSYSQIARHCIW